MNLIPHASTLDELLAHAREEQQPTWGPVHRADGQYRWLRMYLPDMPDVAEFFYKRTTTTNPEEFGEVAVHLTVVGWLFTDKGWAVQNPQLDADGALLPDQESIPTKFTVYVDHRSGSARVRMFRDGGVELQPSVEVPRPDEGWNPRNGGTITAALDYIRLAVL